MNLPRWLMLVFIVAAFGTAYTSLKPHSQRTWHTAAQVASIDGATPPVTTADQINAGTTDSNSFYQTSFISDGTTRLVHAPSLAQVDDHVVAVWFGGTKEGAPDVNLYADRLTLGGQHWGEDWVAMTPQRTAITQKRFIKKLGNAVLAPNADGTLSMFYVSVSLGGWATSALNYAVSRDGGLNFEPPRRLVTSPFFNLSTLVKGTPLHFDDGSIALPAYHEMAGKFGELLQLTTSGELLDKSRITSRRYSLQPVVFVDPGSADKNNPDNNHDNNLDNNLDNNHDNNLDNNRNSATALLRYCGKNPPNRVIAATSNDAGHTWKTSGKTALPNPNSALTGIMLDSGEYLLVLNDTEKQRNRLGLFATADKGKSFRVLHYFDDATSEEKNITKQIYTAKLAESLAAQGFDADTIANAVNRAVETMCKPKKNSCDFQFDYPYLIRTSDGNFHVAYTWNKAFIKHVTFNKAWLEQRL